MPTEMLTGVSVQADSGCMLCRHTRTHRKRMRDHVRNPARKRKCVSGWSRAEGGTYREADRDPE